MATNKYGHGYNSNIHRNIICVDMYVSIYIYIHTLITVFVSVETAR